MKKQILIMLFVFLSGCSQSGVSDNQLFLEKMEKAGNVTGMIASYKEQLQSQPDNYHLLKMLAELYYKADDLESSMFYANHYDSIVKEDKDILYLKGRIHDDLGDYSTSITFFEQAEALGERTPEFYIRYGIVLSKFGNYSEAEKQFNIARLRGDDDITIKNNLAVLYLMQAKYQDAVEILLPLLSQARDNNKVKINLSIALIKQGQDKQAYDILKPLYSDEQLRVLFRMIKEMKNV